MTIVERVSGYGYIDIKIKNGDYDDALSILDERLRRYIDIEEKCQLWLFKAWVLYATKSYTPAIDHIKLVMMCRGRINTSIISQALLVGGMIYLKLGKHKMCYDSITECLRLELHSCAAMDLMEVLKVKIMER